MSLVKILKEKQAKPVIAKVFTEQFSQAMAGCNPYAIAGDGLVRIFVVPVIKL